MIELIFFCFIALVVYVYELRDDFPFWKEMKEKLESFCAHQRTMSQRIGTSDETRSIDMEIDFNVPWGQWAPQAIENYAFDQPTFQTPYVRRYFGPMEMEVAGDQILIYDLELGHVEGVSAREKVFHTVISIAPPELRLPPFMIRPKGIFKGEALLSLEQFINSDSPLDVQFHLETLAHHRTKALFQSELGTEVLIPFLNDRKWTVQWTGNSLIVYQWNHLIDPERLHEVALEVSEFFEVLKLGPEVIDRKMEELIQETSQRANTNSTGIKSR